MYALSNSSRGNPSRAGRGHIRASSSSSGRQRTSEGAHVGGRGHARPSRSRSRSRVINQPANMPQEPALSEMTEDDVLLHGLNYVGFCPKRQSNVKNRELLINRFKAHFGPVPAAVVDLQLELVEGFDQSCSFNHLMMTLHWFKCYQTEHCMSGIWKYGEEFCRNKVIEVANNIRSLFNDKIVIDPTQFDPDEVHWLSVDTVNYITQEFRGTPSTDWYDPKSKSSGVKYEFALPIRHGFCVWKRGPFKPGKNHDKTIFCGAKNKDTPKDQWDRSALYFQLPKGKKAIADSAYEGMADKVTVKRDGQDKAVIDFIDRAQNRQEAYHARLDSYAILRHRFRHGKSTEKKIELHNLCVEALMVVVHFDLHHRPLWET